MMVLLMFCRLFGFLLVSAQLVLPILAVAIDIPGGAEAVVFAGGSNADRSPGGGIFSSDRATGEKLFACGDGCAGNFSYEVPRPVKVVFWTQSIIVYKRYQEFHAPNCSVVKAFQNQQPFDQPAVNTTSDEVVLDPDYDLSDADVVVFHLGILERHYVLPRKKRKGQVWIAGCWEPEDYDGLDSFSGDCSLLHDEKTMALMDGVASYDNEASIPAFFTPPTEEQMRRSAPSWGEDRHVKLASSVFSDCRAEARNDWVKALNSSLANKGKAHAVTFYGKCFNNHHERECDGKDKAVRRSKPGDLQDVWLKAANRCMARPFALVAENSQTPWYVTEKIWNALATGAVPVYWGPPEAKYLVPPGCCLFASDYASTEALADAMLSFDDEKHAAARAWKDSPVQDWGNWSRARRLSRATMVPRLCEAAAARPALGSVDDDADTFVPGDDAGGRRETMLHKRTHRHRNAETQKADADYDDLAGEDQEDRGREAGTGSRLAKDQSRSNGTVSAGRKEVVREGSNTPARAKDNAADENLRSVPVVPDFPQAAVDRAKRSGAHHSEHPGEHISSHRPNEEGVGNQNAQLAKWFKKEAATYHGKIVVKKQRAHKDPQNNDHHHHQDGHFKSQADMLTNPFSSLGRWFAQAGKHMKGKLRGGE